MFRGFHNEDGTFCVLPEGGGTTLCLKNVQHHSKVWLPTIAEAACNAEMCDGCRQALETEQEQEEAASREWRLEAL